MPEITEDNILQEATDFLNELTPQETAVVVGLYGELGAGKTMFAKALAEVLGVKETVTSPTFIIEKIYTLKDQNKNQKFSHLIHIDAYRLESSEELKRLGFDAIASDKNNLIIIEWADKVEDLLPQHTKKVYFKVTGERTRDISYV